MTNLLLIEDIADTNEIRLTLNPNSTDGLTSIIKFEIQLEPTDREEIHWYFNQFLSEPAGDSIYRSEAIETGLRNLGRLLF